MAQQSCRYLTPLLSRVGEKPHSFPASVFINSGFSIRARGEGIQPNIHTFSVFIKHWVSITWESMVRGKGGKKTTQLDFQELVLT